MSPAVLAKDVIIEMLDAEAQPRDADFAKRVDLGFRERARLAFESDFLGRVPRNVCPQPIDQPLQLPGAEKRRRAATEINKAERPAAHDRQLADQFDLAR